MKTVIVCFLLLSLTACKRDEPSDAKTVVSANENIVQLTDEQAKSARVAIGMLERKNISTAIKLSGMVEVPPGNSVSVSFPLGGYLKSSKLLPGMRVKRGEAIAVMEDPQLLQLQQDFLTARADFSFLENEYGRQKELNESKASSDKLFQQTRAKYATQRILVNALGKKLKLVGINADSLDEDSMSASVSVYSAINGYVSKVNINTGKYVNPTDVMFEIINPDEVHLALNVFEKDIHEFRRGQKVVAYSNAYPQRRYRCEVALVGRELSPERSLEVHCEFLERDELLVPGMFMNAEVNTQTNDAWVVPSDAVVSFENRHFVFLSKGNNQFEMMEADIGKSEAGYTEVHPDANVNQRSRLVTKGAYSLLMKLKNTSEE